MQKAYTGFFGGFERVGGELHQLPGCAGGIAPLALDRLLCIRDRKLFSGLSGWSGQRLNAICFSQVYPARRQSRDFLPLLSGAR